MLTGFTRFALRSAVPSKVCTAACWFVYLWDSSQSWQVLQRITGPAVLCTVLQPGPHSSAVPDVAPASPPQDCACALSADQDRSQFCIAACYNTWHGTDTQPRCCRDSVRGDRYGSSRSSRDGRSDRDYRCTAMSLPSQAHCHEAAALRQKACWCSCMAVACPCLALRGAHGQIAGARLTHEPPPHSTRQQLCACSCDAGPGAYSQVLP